MNRIAAVVAGLSLAFVGISETIADTINVPGDQPTIAAAINASVNGDVINIAAGTYYEYNLNPGGKAITIQGDFDGTNWNTIVQGSNTNPNMNGSVFVINHGEGPQTIIKDLEITGGTGSIPEVSGDIYGGGIYCNNSSPTISNCQIVDNHMALGMSNGGGLFSQFGSPTIIGCNFEGNSTALMGGGVHLIGGSPTVTNCSMFNNNATYGGGITFGSWLGDDKSEGSTLTGCQISYNISSDAGGGVLCMLDSPNISNCNISYNYGLYGGGIGLRGISNPNITNCNVTFNNRNPYFTSGQGLKGGGISCEGGSNPTIKDCTISSNRTLESGGGIWCEQSQPTIMSSTICGNTPDQQSGCQISLDNSTIFAPLCPADPGDVDGDGDVDTNDLAQLRGSLGLCASDTDMDGDTDIEDLLNVVAGWGTTCP